MSAKETLELVVLTSYLLTIWEAPRVRDALIGGPLEGVERWFDMMVKDVYRSKEDKDQIYEY